MKKTIVYFLCFLSILIIAILLYPNKTESQAVVEVEVIKVVNSTNIKVYAFEKVLDKWGEKQWAYFSDLVYRESKWSSSAQNPNSTAYGLGQFLNSTWATVGCQKTPNPYEQIDCMIKYIEARYTTPQKAMVFWNKNKWY
jgi:hypothetical protein